MTGFTGRRWLLSGRVQGVGFRVWCAGRAGELDLRGWVRNLRDGRVEVSAAGPDGALDALDAALRIGPAGAAVTALAVEPWIGPVADGPFQRRADADRPENGNERRPG